MSLSFHVVKEVSEIIVILFELPFSKGISNCNSLFLFRAVSVSSILVASLLAYVHVPGTYECTMS